MSITLLQGTFAGASTTKARDLRQAWVGAFSGVSGWTIKDHDYVNGTSERSVIENDNNFALMIYNSTTTSDLTLRIAFGQSYNETTHVLSNLSFFNYAVFPNNITSNSNALTGQTFNPNSVGSSPDQVHGTRTVSATAGQTDWTVHISNTSNTAILTFNDGTTNIGKAIYIGEYQNLIANPALTVTYPYGCSIVSSENHIASGIIESVGNPSTTLNFNRFSTRNYYISQVGAPAKAGTADYYSSTPTLNRTSEIYLVRQSINPIQDDRGVAVESNLYGWLIGKYNHIIHARVDNATWGQTVEVDGKTYMLAGKKNTSSNSWANETWWVEI